MLTRHPLIKNEQSAATPALKIDPLPSAPQHQYILALQRKIGNRATLRLIHPTPPQPILQRNGDPEQLKAFSLEYLQFVDRLRKSKKMAYDDRLLANYYHDTAKALGLDDNNPTMFAQLTRLMNFAEGTTEESLKDILNTYDPKKRMGDKAFTSVAGASFAPSGADPDPQRARHYDPSGFHPTSSTSLVGEMNQQLDLTGSVSEARINMTIDKIETVYKHHLAQYTGQDSSNVLLVYMGPEWFFNLFNYPISRDEKESIIEKFRALSLLYPEMLIVPGTILSGDPVFDKAKTLIGYHKNIANTAPVLWNGNLLHTINKKDPAGDIPQGVDKKNWKTGKEDPVFDLGDLRFAIDICADHGSRRAQKYFQKQKRKADVHLVTAAGRTFEPEGGATREGGVGFGSDVAGGGATGSVTHVDEGGERTGTNIEPTVLGGETLTPGRDPKKGAKEWLKYYPAQPLFNVVDVLQDTIIEQDPIELSD